MLSFLKKRLSIYFSSANKGSRQGTFIPNPSPEFTAFPSTLILQEYFLSALRN